MKPTASKQICLSRSPAETEALGEAWGREAQPGWLIGLTGDLGAGKTQLVRGVARGLGSPARVHSPTFALLNEYRDGRLQLFHLDLYRLNGPAEVLAAGLEEYIQPAAGVTVVEWIERWLDNGASVAGRFRRVHLETLGENERRITYEDFGP